MKKLLIDDLDAERLLDLFKSFISLKGIKLEENCNGMLEIEDYSGENKFILDYWYSSNSKVFNFRELKHNYNLIRINLNNKFHKNSYGNKVYGNRINVFSTNEYILKGDEKTYMKCYPLPFYKNQKVISNDSDFVKILFELIDYVNITNGDELKIINQRSFI